MGKKKLLLIGWDAADWEIIGPLLNKGHMPALKRIIDNGVYGNMSTMNPPYSPMLWTSVVTGKTPDKHGVLGFVEVMPDLEGVRPVTTNSRKSRTVWNILHNQGYKSNLVGWWPSYPAEPINGVVVSDKFQKVNPDPKKQSPLAEDAIHPKSARKDLLDLRMFPFEVTKEHILPFIPNAGSIDQEKDKALIPFSRMLSHNVTVHNAATKLMRTTEWDLMCVYYDLIDHFCHTFMKYHPPKLPQVSEPDFEMYKDVIVGAYRFQDMMLGRKLELIDEDTTVIVMSDHGFESGHKRIIDMPKVQAAPALEHRQFGMFAAMGPNIKKNEKIFGLGLIDIAPTILHHFGLPVGEDMDGKVLLDMFLDPSRPEYIESWEEIDGDFGELKNKNQDTALSDQDVMEQLIELGYVERPDEKKEIAILKTKCDLKHNLARVYLAKKDYNRARDLLLELIEEDEPIDLAPFYMDLLTISMQTQQPFEAEKYLNKIKDSKTKVKYNLFFPETEILVAKGELNKALNILIHESQLRKNAEVFFRIGEIQFKLLQFVKAKDAFLRAIEIESDRAKYHRYLAETYIELGEYEEAVEYSLTSIELIKFFPSAHFTLGRALEKMGDLDNAKIAYETAERLTPRTYDKARMAKENVEVAKKRELENSNENSLRYIENQIVIVSGLPRSGTSLMMQMLAKGGLEILTDDHREADISNPKGYYEYDPVMSIHKDNSWLDEAQNKGLKVVAPLLRYLSSQFRYKVIFMVRDLNEVVKSQQIMRGKDPEALPITLFDSYNTLLDGVKIWSDKEPNVEILYINYKDVVNEPEPAINKVTSFLGLDLDKKSMETCVDKNLYRNKDVR